VKYAADTGRKGGGTRERCCVDLEGVVFCAAAGNTARKGGATAAVLVWIQRGLFSARLRGTPPGRAVPRQRCWCGFGRGGFLWHHRISIGV